jgi:ubiquinone/menaquinone biosynthesis C-methylase UbiE
MLSPAPAAPLSLADLIAGLRAAGEDTRLRILALLADGELTVTDLTDVLGQSQPRVSRHLKLLAEAGLIERSREGAWAFFRIADRGLSGSLARMLLQRVDPSDAVLQVDRERLAAVRLKRAEAAQAYFANHAAEWDKIRSLHAPESVVEAAIRAVIGSKPIDSVLDLGTGTGRMIALFAPFARRLVGIDASHAMLAVARSNFEREAVKGVELKQGDLYALPVERNAFDLVILHQVLHFLDDPSRAIREAVQALRPGGRILLVDFAPHENEFFREALAHRRLGFEAEQVSEWLGDCGLEEIRVDRIEPPRIKAKSGASTDQQLTVLIVTARDPRRLLADEGSLA